MFGTDLGKLTPIWRHAPTASTLRLEADGDATDHAVFRIADPDHTYFLGRTERRRDGAANDFVVPNAWKSISHDQATLVSQPGGVLLTNTSSKRNVFVRGEAIPRGTARSLRHGDVVQIGHYVGTFADGRYYAAAPAAATDGRTGLLSRAGLVAEIAGVLATGLPQILLVLRCPEDPITGEREPAPADPERLAVVVTLAVHRLAPSIPVARIGIDVAALLPSETVVAAIAAVADRVVGARCASGFVALKGTSDQATTRLEACLGALSRIVIAGRELAGPEDLTRYALVPTPLNAFPMHAQPLFALGGGAVLFALGQFARLEQLVPQVVPVLELEFVELLGARMGPRDVVSFAGPGLLLFAMPGDVEHFAQEVAVMWHARGPVTADTLEIDRYLSTHLLARSDLGDLTERTLALARGDAFSLSASGLPAPLALAACAADEAEEPVERTRALVHVAELTWKLLAMILQASARDVHAHARPTVASPSLDVWPAPWRALAREAAHSLTDPRPDVPVPVRVVELASVAASADCEGTLRSSMDTIGVTAALVAAPVPDPATIERILPRLEQAIRELLASLVPLQGWTLVAITKAEIVDRDGTAQRIEYIDYTGPSPRGSQQCVTVMGFRGLGRFTYLARWNEGLAIVLEPHVRLWCNPALGNSELFLADAPIAAPGTHRYRSVGDAQEISLPVTSKQLGISPARGATDDAAKR